ncbi:MAG: hypothetical protein FWD39_03710 [Clostridiales bacterium]|nr:hypothetical protein [Clostridiales bacterium]
MKKVLLIGMMLAFVISCLGCTVEYINPPDNNGGNPSTPEWVGYTFHYYSDTDSTLNLFVEWIKSGGTIEVKGKNYSEYSYNRPFLDWVKGQEEIAIPVIRNEAYRLHAVTLTASGSDGYHDGYRMVFSAQEAEKVPENGRMAGIFFKPLSEAEKEQSLEDIVKNFLKDIPDLELKRGELDSPWGEYWISNSTRIYFIKSNCLIHMGLYAGVDKNAPWVQEYFSYFDFETVPLK